MVKESVKQQILRLEESIVNQKEQLEGTTLIFIPPVKVKAEEEKRQKEINNLMAKVEDLEQKKANLERKYEYLKHIVLINEDSWFYRKVLRYIGASNIKLFILEIVLMLFVLLLAIKVLGVSSIVNNRFGVVSIFDDKYKNALLEWFLMENIIFWGFYFTYKSTLSGRIKSERVLRFLSIVSLMFFLVVLFIFMVIIML